MKRTVPCDFFEQCGEQAAYFSRPLKKHICIGHALALAELLGTKRLPPKPSMEPNYVPCYFYKQCGLRATLLWKPTGQSVCKGHAAALLILAAQKENERNLPKPKPPMKPKKSTLLKIKDGGRILYYRPHRTKPNGICGDLVGYRKWGKDHWY
jgi:hypothetical protein